MSSDGSSASPHLPVSPRLVFATANTHKLEELRAILAPHLADLPRGLIAPMSDFGVDSPVEDGATFEENSLIKARHVCAATGLPAVADDSGLSVDIMGGAPGIFSARWCGRHGDDRANLDLLLSQLADIPDALRDAAFIAAASLVMPDGREFVKVGRVEGTLLRARRGEGGFGYDPIFVPHGHKRTTAEMSAAEKNALSHRGIAFEALTPLLIQVLSSAGA